MRTINTPVRQSEHWTHFQNQLCTIFTFWWIHERAFAITFTIPIYLLHVDQNLRSIYFQWRMIFRFFSSSLWLSLSRSLHYLNIPRMRRKKKHTNTKSIDWYKRAEQERRPENNAQMNIWNDTIQMIFTAIELYITLNVAFWFFWNSSHSPLNCVQSHQTSTIQQQRQEQPKYQNRNSHALRWTLAVIEIETILHIYTQYTN